jgi:hypothetical protein
MKVTNKAGFSVNAVCYCDIGEGPQAGEEVLIRPEETKKVEGPAVDSRRRSGHLPTVVVPGEITCHEGDDDKENFTFGIAQGEHINLGSDNKGVVVWHCEDPWPGG